MAELQEERCAACGKEVPPREAHEVRVALDHATPDQRAQFTAIYGFVPALLCAECFNANLGAVNQALNVTNSQRGLDTT